MYVRAGRRSGVQPLGVNVKFNLKTPQTLKYGN
nr:MAG TPA: hypothetical protein [Caudoviricetes sp.]